MSLTEEQVQTIKATVPVVKEHGAAITKEFYSTLLHDVPELNNIFNHANQVQGHQAQALANALYAYAANIDNLNALGPAVNKISQKHASLYIQASQYDIVGEYLLKAMGTILGSALTPPILDAWAAAYKQLADIMINMEKDMLQEAGEWAGWRDFVITKKVREAEYITSFYLEPKDKEPLPSFLPGRYVSIQTDVPDLHYLQSRQYSLSSAPNENYYRITVKKERGAPRIGEADAPTHPGYVSTILHDRKEVGDVLQVSFPRGDFYLDTTKTVEYPVVLISAGVGMTPLISILETLVKRKHTAPISWIHGTRNSRVQAFGDHIRDLEKDAKNLRVRVFNEGGDDKQSKYDFVGRVELDSLDREGDLHLGNGSTEYYVCGPESFMADVKKKLVGFGVRDDKIKIEMFGTAMLAKE